MMNETTGGVSKRSLILLGAFAALALNKDLRRNLVYGTRDALDTAQATLDETVKPALSTAAQQAQQAAALAAGQAGQTIDHLREDGPQRVQSLLGTAQGVVGTLAATAAERAAQLRKEAEHAAEQARREYEKQYVPRLHDAQENLSDLADERRHQAQKALKQARKQGMVALADLGERVSNLRENVLETADDHRRDAERAIARARKQAEKDLRAGRKNWNQKKLEQAIEKRIAPVHAQVQRELTRLEKEAGRNARTLKAELRPAPKSSGLSSGVTALALIGTGAVVLARVPQARQAVLGAVEMVSPDAAKSLHSYSKQVRNLVGDMWLSSSAHAAPAPAPAAKPAPAADAKPTEAKPTETTSTDNKSADSKPATPQAEAPKTDTPKTDAPKSN